MKKRALFINADKYAPDNETLRIESLKYRINKYIDVFMKENKPELLKEWLTHYIDDQSENKIMRVTESKRIMEEIGFKNIKFEKEDDIEMMEILTARK